MKMEEKQHVHESNFALGIKKVVHKESNKVDYIVGSTMHGISMPEILLIVEAWLEKSKESIKDPIKQSLKFNMVQKK